MSINRHTTPPTPRRKSGLCVKINRRKSKTKVARLHLKKGTRDEQRKKFLDLPRRSERRSVKKICNRSPNEARKIAQHVPQQKKNGKPKTKQN